MTSLKKLLKNTSSLVAPALGSIVVMASNAAHGMTATAHAPKVVCVNNSAAADKALGKQYQGPAFAHFKKSADLSLQKIDQLNRVANFAFSGTKAEVEYVPNRGILIGKDAILKATGDLGANSVLILKAASEVSKNSESAIFGKIQSNTQVVITTPGSVIMGNGAEINVAALTIAAGKEITGIQDTNVSYKSVNPEAVYVAGGKITVGENGMAVFFAPNMDLNNGYVSAKTQAYVAGNGKASIDLYGDGLTSFEVESHTLEQAKALASKVNAGDGFVILTSEAALKAIRDVVNVKDQGAYNAQLVGDDIIIGGNAALTVVKADVTAKNIAVKGTKVDVREGTTLDAKTVLVGGEWFGGKADAQYLARVATTDAQKTAIAQKSGFFKAGENSAETTLDKGVVINAADKAVIWSQGNTVTDAQIKSQGGVVEISGAIWVGSKKAFDELEPREKALEKARDDLAKAKITQQQFINVLKTVLTVDAILPTLTSGAGLVLYDPKNILVVPTGFFNGNYWAGNANGANGHYGNGAATVITTYASALAEIQGANGGTNSAALSPAGLADFGAGVASGISANTAADFGYTDMPTFLANYISKGTAGNANNIARSADAATFGAPVLNTDANSALGGSTGGSMGATTWGLNFDSSAGATVILDADQLSAQWGSAANGAAHGSVALYASNDVVILGALTSSGNAGDLTIKAGRKVYIGANITGDKAANGGSNIIITAGSRDTTYSSTSAAYGATGQIDTSRGIIMSRGATITGGVGTDGKSITISLENNGGATGQIRLTNVVAPTTAGNAGHGEYVFISNTTGTSASSKGNILYGYQATVTTGLQTANAANSATPFIFNTTFGDVGTSDQALVISNGYANAAGGIKVAGNVGGNVYLKATDAAGTGYTQGVDLGHLTGGVGTDVYEPVLQKLLRDDFVPSTVGALNGGYWKYDTATAPAFGTPAGDGVSFLTGTVKVHSESTPGKVANSTMFGLKATGDVVVQVDGANGSFHLAEFTSSPLHPSYFGGSIVTSGDVIIRAATNILSSANAGNTQAVIKGKNVALISGDASPGTVGEKDKYIPVNASGSLVGFNGSAGIFNVQSIGASVLNVGITDATTDSTGGLLIPHFGTGGAAVAPATTSTALAKDASGYLWSVITTNGAAAISSDANGSVNLKKAKDGTIGTITALGASTAIIIESGKAITGATGHYLDMPNSTTGSDSAFSLNAKLGDIGSYDHLIRLKSVDGQAGFNAIASNISGTTPSTGSIYLQPLTSMELGFAEKANSVAGLTAVATGIKVTGTGTILIDALDPDRDATTGATTNHKVLTLNGDNTHSSVSAEDGLIFIKAGAIDGDTHAISGSKVSLYALQDAGNLTTTGKIGKTNPIAVTYNGTGNATAQVKLEATTNAPSVANPGNISVLLSDTNRVYSVTGTSIAAQTFTTDKEAKLTKGLTILGGNGAVTVGFANGGSLLLGERSDVLLTSTEVAISSPNGLIQFGGANNVVKVAVNNPSVAIAGYGLILAGGTGSTVGETGVFGTATAEVNLNKRLWWTPVSDTTLGTGIVGGIFTGDAYIQVTGTAAIGTTTAVAADEGNGVYASPANYGLKDTDGTALTSVQAGGLSLGAGNFSLFATDANSVANQPIYISHTFVKPLVSTDISTIVLNGSSVGYAPGTGGTSGTFDTVNTRLSLDGEEGLISLYDGSTLVLQAETIGGWSAGGHGTPTVPIETARLKIGTGTVGTASTVTVLGQSTNAKFHVVNANAASIVNFGAGAGGEVADWTSTLSAPPTTRAGKLFNFTMDTDASVFSVTGAANANISFVGDSTANALVSTGSVAVSTGGKIVVSTATKISAKNLMLKGVSITDDQGTPADAHFAMVDGGMIGLQTTNGAAIVTYTGANVMLGNAAADAPMIDGISINSLVTVGGAATIIASNGDLTIANGANVAGGAFTLTPTSGKITTNGLVTAGANANFNATAGDLTIVDGLVVTGTTTLLAEKNLSIAGGSSSTGAATLTATDGKITLADAFEGGAAVNATSAHDIDLTKAGLLTIGNVSLFKATNGKLTTGTAFKVKGAFGLKLETTNGIGDAGLITLNGFESEGRLSLSALHSSVKFLTDITVGGGFQLDQKDAFTLAHVLKVGGNTSITSTDGDVTISTPGKLVFTAPGTLTLDSKTGSVKATVNQGAHAISSLVLNSATGVDVTFTGTGALTTAAAANQILVSGTGDATVKTSGPLSLGNNGGVVNVVNGNVSLTTGENSALIAGGAGGATITAPKGSISLMTHSYPTFAASALSAGTSVSLGFSGANAAFDLSTTGSQLARALGVDVTSLTIGGLNADKTIAQSVLLTGDFDIVTKLKLLELNIYATSINEGAGATNTTVAPGAALTVVTNGDVNMNLKAGDGSAANAATFNATVGGKLTTKLIGQITAKMTAAGTGESSVELGGTVNDILTLSGPLTTSNPTSSLKLDLGSSNAGSVHGVFNADDKKIVSPTLTLANANGSYDTETKDLWIESGIAPTVVNTSTQLILSKASSVTGALSVTQKGNLQFKGAGSLASTGLLANGAVKLIVTGNVTIDSSSNATADVLTGPPATAPHIVATDFTFGGNFVPGTVGNTKTLLTKVATFKADANLKNIVLNNGTNALDVKESTVNGAKASFTTTTGVLKLLGVQTGYDTLLFTSNAVDSTLIDPVYYGPLNTLGITADNSALKEGDKVSFDNSVTWQGLPTNIANNLVLGGTTSFKIDGGATATTGERTYTLAGLTINGGIDINPATKFAVTTFAVNDTKTSVPGTSTTYNLVGTKILGDSSSKNGLVFITTAFDLSGVDGASVVAPTVSLSAVDSIGKVQPLGIGSSLVPTEVTFADAKSANVFLNGGSKIKSLGAVKTLTVAGNYNDLITTADVALTINADILDLDASSILGALSIKNGSAPSSNVKLKDFAGTTLSVSVSGENETKLTAAADGETHKLTQYSSAAGIKGGASSALTIAGFDYTALSSGSNLGVLNKDASDVAALSYASDLLFVDNTLASGTEGALAGFYYLQNTTADGAALDAFVKSALDKDLNSYAGALSKVKSVVDMVNMSTTVQARSSFVNTLIVDTKVDAGTAKLDKNLWKRLIKTSMVGSSPKTTSKSAKATPVAAAKTKKTAAGA